MSLVAGLQTLRIATLEATLGAFRAADTMAAARPAVEAMAVRTDETPLGIAIDQRIAAIQAAVFFRDNTRYLDFERRLAAIQALVFFRDTSRDLAFEDRVVAIQTGRG